MCAFAHGPRNSSRSLFLFLAHALSIVSSLLNDGVLPRATSAASRRLEVNVGHESVELLGERALYWPREATLFVADMHLGKAAAFRSLGVPLPRGTTAGDLDRLSRLVGTSGARRIVVLGDFLHAAKSRVAALDAAFTDWRERHRDLAVTLVRGNHDVRAGDPPSSWRIEVVAEP